MKRIIFNKLFILITACWLCCPGSSDAYSVLTHLAVIDASWEKSIKPLLVKKYPGATADQLKDAHAYAYGGAVAPDMGYYPFGSKLFTNLVHYVRSGDFTNALIDESKDINDYAFALGFACHYYADKYGHPIATNRSVPMVYPKDKQNYGNVVTYEQDPISHVRMEFEFDVLQTARGNYASQQYHDFIGFKVSRGLMERAFLKTYGLDINNVFTDFPLAIESFRWVVKSLIPEITKAAWTEKKGEIMKSTPGMTRRKFEYKMHNTNYYQEFGKKHQKPGFFAGVLSVVIRLIPKFGPFKDLKLKVPGPEAEKLFIQSFDTVLDHYTVYLKTEARKNPCLPNIDFDTGNETIPGEYGLTDQTYGDLVLRLKEEKFKRLNPLLKQNIIAFFGRSNIADMAKEHPEDWAEVNKAFEELKTVQPD